MASRRLSAEKTWQSEFRGAIHGVTQNLSPIFSLIIFLGVGEGEKEHEGFGVIKIKI